jgi:hypothetical protein
MFSSSEGVKQLHSGLQSAIELSMLHVKVLVGSLSYLRLEVYMHKNSYIRNMYFVHLKPAGVSERISSANLEASISEEYQTQ